LRIERHGGMRPCQQQYAHATPSPSFPHHDGYSINPEKFHVGSKKMRPESGRMENWYVIAIPKIDLPAAFVLDPGYGFSLDLSVDTKSPWSKEQCLLPWTHPDLRPCWREIST
jgi:hypothetical protein